MTGAPGRTPARYDQVADFYEAFAPDAYDDPPSHALLTLAGDVKGLRLLDMACGHGMMSREMARRGARVVGADISEALLRKARAREQTEPLGISYLQANLASPGALSGETFDAVVCRFGLSDIDDLDGALATVGRVLKPGGFFAFCILHPCFPGWQAKGATPSWSPGRGYFREEWWVPDGPPGGIRPRVGVNHRTLSTYFNTLAHNGLILEEMAEPQPPASWLEVAPEVGPVPVYLAARCRKA